MKIVLLSPVKALSTTQRLLFVHHSANQNLILEKYRNEICLLDALYKTAKYSIPLFFLAVKTNVDYQIAGSFAVQGETTDAILEAVTILKSSNNKWKPLAFMIDNCNEEISAIEEHFSGSNNNNNAVLYSKLFYLHIQENLRIDFCTFATIMNYFLAAATHGCYTNKLSQNR